MSKSKQRAWLITNYSPLQIVSGYDSIQPADLIVAVDAGLKRCLELNLVPDVLIGDFDSVEPELLSRVPESCHKLTFPGMKNETDTQLALEYCILEKIPEVFICNDLTGRIDHALALIQNLQQASKYGIKASIISSSQILTLLDEQNHFAYPVQSTLSLISLSETSIFTSSHGLKYSLDNLRLYNWQSKGISNEISAPEQEIILSSGTVLAIITPR
jgi:thiamine pyrophosphokinase